jgi:hypothetical protein
MTVASDAATVTLVGGFTIGKDVLDLAWDLEDRGLDMRVLAGDVLQVLPVERLQSADAAAIRKHKAELVALSRYVARMWEPAAATQTTLRLTVEFLVESGEAREKGRRAYS